jgi:hypothetical protein
VVHDEDFLQLLQVRAVNKLNLPPITEHKFSLKLEAARGVSSVSDAVRQTQPQIKVDEEGGASVPMHSSI